MTPLEIAATAAAYLLAFARLLDVARPLWAWVKWPWAQPLLPILIVALPQMAGAFGAIETRMDLTFAIVAALGTLSTSVRGALPAAHFAKLSPPAVDELRVARGGTSKLPPAGVVMLVLGAVGIFGVNACSPGVEKPPCDPASYAALSAACGDDPEECDRAIDERQVECSKRIEADQ